MFGTVTNLRHDVRVPVLLLVVLGQSHSVALLGAAEVLHDRVGSRFLQRSTADDLHSPPFEEPHVVRVGDRLIVTIGCHGNPFLCRDECLAPCHKLYQPHKKSIISQSFFLFEQNPRALYVVLLQQIAGNGEGKSTTPHRRFVVA